MTQFYSQNNHFRKHDLALLKMKNLHSKTVLEYVTDMESYISAVWIH